MRQDRRFQLGEAVSSKSVARLVSATFDRLVTVDPHLHRYPALSTLYTIPDITLHAAPALADWIAAHVEAPLLIGPDEESEQWVRSEEHTSELQSLMRISYAVFCLKKKTETQNELNTPKAKDTQKMYTVNTLN